jgi:predicted phosphodiesterase
MRPFSWLHISDIHLRERDSWPQRVVMDAMSDDISRVFADEPADFILVSGDLAYSGKADDYALVERFLDKIGAAASVPRERIFCIPGNHDIDRDRQKFCFQGARSILQDQSSTDSFLGTPAGDDLQTLLQRERHYRAFQATFCADQERAATADGLGYVARFCIDGVHLAIIGLDSAWLAEGGSDDHLKLLIGERQVIDALRIIREGGDAPHIVIAMSHHPLHLLQDFDRRHVTRRLEQACHFVHCGHLHEPEDRMAGQDAGGCLTIAAGASFESRQSANAYAVVTVDLLSGIRALTTHRYSYSTGTFSPLPPQRYRIEVRPTGTCALGELAAALREHTGTAWPCYFAALLLDKKAEIPVPLRNGFAMAAVGALETAADSDLTQKTDAFFLFRNALRVFYGREALDKILRRHGDGVVQYGAKLAAIATGDPALKAKLDAQEADAGVLARTEPQSAFAHTSDLLAELAREHDWEALREQASRHINAPDFRVATQATRLLALALGHSEETDDKRRATELYRALTAGENSEPTDAGNLVTLLMDLQVMDEAKTLAINHISAGQLRRPGLDTGRRRW